MQLSETSSDTDEFRVYQIEGLKRTSSVRRAERWSKRVPPPRYRSMSTEQDWTDVWPTASTFKWSAVPFPVRQGYVEVKISGCVLDSLNTLFESLFLSCHSQSHFIRIFCISWTY